MNYEASPELLAMLAELNGPVDLVELADSIEGKGAIFQGTLDAQGLTYSPDIIQTYARKLRQNSMLQPREHFSHSLSLDYLQQAAFKLALTND